MTPPDDEREWDDPPGVFDEHEEEPADGDVAWPTHGVSLAAVTGWLALGYALAEAAAVLLGLGGSLDAALPVAVVGVGLLVGVHLGNGDIRVWRR